MRVQTSRRAARAKPELSERELQLCAKCHRTRYEHERGLLPDLDHDFVERAGARSEAQPSNSAPKGVVTHAPNARLDHSG
jgi:hypothetical protein